MQNNNKDTFCVDNNKVLCEDPISATVYFNDWERLKQDITKLPENIKWYDWAIDILLIIEGIILPIFINKWMEGNFIWLLCIFSGVIFLACFILFIFKFKWGWMIQSSKNDLNTDVQFIENQWLKIEQKSSGKKSKKKAQEDNLSMSKITFF